MSAPAPSHSVASEAARVLGVLAGGDMPIDLLARWAESAQIVLAADAGLDRLRQAGRLPDHAIGDFDSAADRSGMDPSQITIDHDHEGTDCDKLLALAARQNHAHITLASIEGDQIDHMLATLHSASRSPLKVRVALRRGVGWILNAGDQVTALAEPGRRVSLVPIEEVRGAILSGVEWRLNGEDLHPSGRSGISNRAVDNRVTASIQSGAALLFVGYLDEEMPVW